MSSLSVMGVLMLILVMKTHTDRKPFGQAAHWVLGDLSVLFRGCANVFSREPVKRVFMGCVSELMECVSEFMECASEFVECVSEFLWDASAMLFGGHASEFLGGRVSDTSVQKGILEVFVRSIWGFLCYFVSNHICRGVSLTRLHEKCSKYLFFLGFVCEFFGGRVADTSVQKGIWEVSWEAYGDFCVILCQIILVGACR